MVNSKFWGKAIRVDHWGSGDWILKWVCSITTLQWLLKQQTLKHNSLNYIASPGCGLDMHLHLDEAQKLVAIPVSLANSNCACSS